MNRSQVITLSLVLSVTPFAPSALAQAPASAVPPAPAAGEVSKTANPELVGMLTSQLGVTPKQAEGGAGAVFSYAKDKLKADDYAKVAKAVPGVDGLIKAAPAAETKATSGGAMDTLTGAASQLGGSVGATAALAPAFQKLGVSGETVGKFLPIVVGYVTKKGGTGVGDLLGGVLK